MKFTKTVDTNFDFLNGSALKGLIMAKQLWVIHAFNPSLDITVSMDIQLVNPGPVLNKS